MSIRETDKGAEVVYASRQQAVLRHIAAMVDIDLPDLPERLDFQGTGFQSLPNVELVQSSGKRKPVSAHIEGGFWIAKMYCEPEHDYDKVIRRLLLIVEAEERSGKPRYIEVSDFIIAQLARIYMLFKGTIRVSAEVWNEVERQLTTYRYATFHEPMSENHKVIHLSSEWFAIHRFPDAAFYDGLTGEEKKRQVKQNIIRFLEKRLKYGWSEFDSSGYYNVDFVALLNLIAVEQDLQVKALAQKTLDFMLVDLLHHSTNGYVGGAKGRVKLSNIVNSKIGVFWPLYVCTGYPEHMEFDDHMEWSTSFFATSAYRPHPAIAVIGTERVEPYEVKERNVLYTMPDDEQVTGSLKRYHYVTKDYVIGSIVQKDELEPYNFHRWLNGHQELSWSIVFASNPEALIFSSHPGHDQLVDWGMHDYWTGDTHCDCHRYVQRRNVLLGRNDIRKEEQAGWIHFYIPKHAFDQVREDYGWLLLQSGNAIAALKPEPGYYWTKEGPWAEREIIVPAASSAFAMEIFDDGQYTLDELLPLLKNRSVSLADGIAFYHSLSGVTLELDAQGTGKVNGSTMNYGHYPKFGSKYVYSEWGSDRLSIKNQASDTGCWL
ncbi:hypothetical protein [Paenibacillus agaridevorans]|uniref:hypothetical protein n=1 Tax=Paenibacillus agaridevorans TaxID=171404 RepID=UPI001BE40176|nr:hypothetical protein [Paenibacillus agaridevorans]